MGSSELIRLCALATVALCASACSMFSIHDHYASAFDPTNDIVYPNQPVDLDVKPAADTRFASIGPFALPIVPVSFTLTARDSIELDVVLELRRDLDYSLAWRPCLALRDRSELCASSARVDWNAETKLDDHYARVPAVNTYQEWSRGFGLGSPGGREERVSRADILRRGGYSGTPPIAFHRISAKFVFPCGGECPGRFSLDAARLVDVETKPVRSETVTFRAERRTVYSPYVSLGETGLEWSIPISVEDRSGEAR